MCFSTFYDDSAAGKTIVGLRQREYTAPAWKYPTEFREALSPALSSLLDWSLPLRDPGAAYPRVYERVLRLLRSGSLL